MFTKRNFIAFTSASLLALATGAPAMSQDRKMKIVASFSILADLAREVGGDRVTVEPIIGPDQDAHHYEPKPGDAKRLAGADIVLVNGLGFDTFMHKLVEASGAKPRRIVASDGLSFVQRPAGKPSEKGHDHGHGKKGHDHDHGHGKSASAVKDDPHVWQSLVNARVIVAAIAKALSDADPAGKSVYDANLAAYTAKLDALDAEFRPRLAALPANRRSFATMHDAFRYLARDYNLTSHALQGISTHAQPSAGDLSRIIRQLKALKTPAAFLENVTDSRAINQIARESGAKVSGTLYSDALSLADGPASSYIGMMRHNLGLIAAALTP